MPLVQGHQGVLVSVVMSLANMIDHIPDDRPVAILMRHAERESLASVQDTISTPLNAAGVLAARELGTQLARFGQLHLHHSPVPRCAQTAELLGEGACTVGGQSQMHGINEILGGPYMKDWQAVMAQVLQSGVMSFTRDWFAGRVSTGLTKEAFPSAREQLSLLVDQLGQADPAPMTLNVSHDWNVLLVRHHFLNLPTHEAGWPDFMEGVVASLDDGKLRLQSGAKTVYLELPLPGQAIY